MYSKQTIIINKTGLHARPASDFVLLAKRFTSDITIRNADKAGKAVNAKSIMQLLTECIGRGTTIEISADGKDETDAVNQLVELIESNFGE